jgi:hypothetical protein
VTGGLNDTREPYWSPAKWVARLRDVKTDDNTLILRTEMGSGHFGVSGFYDAQRETAFLYAFFLMALGMEGLAAGSAATPMAARRSDAAGARAAVRPVRALKGEPGRHTMSRTGWRAPDLV